MAKAAGLAAIWRQAGRWRLLPAALLAVLLLGAIVFLALEVRLRLAALERANSDNTQWVMMQAEVEVLRLQQALAAAAASPDSERLDEVRRWFNVLYSRISMLEQSVIYAPLLASEDYMADHRLIRGYLDSRVGLIDASDPVLAEALDRVGAELPAIRAAAREMTLNALSDFAAQSDMNRESISATLIRLAVLVALLVALLGGAAVVLARLFVWSQAQAGALRETGERLSTIVTTSADAIVVTDAEGSIRAFNPAAEAIFGLSAEAAMGRNALKLLFAEAADGPQQTGMVTALRNRGISPDPLRIEVDARRADGTVFPAEVSIARPSDMEQGGDALVVAFVRDISDRRAAERDLTRALDRALAGEKAKAEFLAVMSHEMRTPLAGLLGSMELMRKGGLTPAQAELMGVMEGAGGILLEHVNSVLDLSRAEAGGLAVEAVEFDLDRLVDETVANQAGLALAAGNRMRVERLSGDLGRVRGDPGRVRQVLLNLVGNAVKFTRGGEITVETERLAGRGGAVGQVELRVIDTGIGIAEADLERIFEDFVTLDASYGRRAGGTGLGLGIARRLARAMGGEIGAESEAGEGSLFWLRLPLPPVAEGEAVADPLPVAVAEEGAERAGVALEVLLVEDHQINRLILRRFLEAGGHRVTEAADGQEAVERAAERGFDVILMDISMPRMDGLAATRAIRSGGGPSARSRILALTAHALPQERVAFRAAGMDMALTKPIAQAALLEAVERAVGGAGEAVEEEAAVAPVLDAAGLGDLTRHVGPVTAASLIRRLIDEGDRSVEALGRLAPEAEGEEILRICHRMAGSAGTFGTRRLREVLVSVEAALKTGDTAGAARGLMQVPGVWQATREALVVASAAMKAA